MFGEPDCDQCVAGSDLMSADGGIDDAFVARLRVLFAREIFQPMFQHAQHAPADVSRLIGEFRERLDALDLVIRTSTGLEGRGGSAPGAFPGATTGGGHQPAMAASDVEAYDDIGRNQRSRLRELAILEVLSGAARPFSLAQLMTALDARGFDDTSSAVVSQLHRLKKTGIVEQAANGIYEITDGGLAHLRKLRASFGALAG